MIFKLWLRPKFSMYLLIIQLHGSLLRVANWGSCRSSFSLRPSPGSYLLVRTLGAKRSLSVAVNQYAYHSLNQKGTFVSLILLVVLCHKLPLNKCHVELPSPEEVLVSFWILSGKLPANTRELFPQTFEPVLVLACLHQTNVSS